MAKQRDRIAQLERKREQLRAQLQREEAKLREQKRRLETRQKILIGSWLLSEIAAGRWSEDKMRSEMDRYLTADRDRDLFGLPPLSRPESRASAQDSDAPGTQSQGRSESQPL